MHAATMESDATSAFYSAKEIIVGDVWTTGPAMRANYLRVASAMARLGIQQGDRIALLLRNDIAFLEATFAAQHLGAYAVPINWHSTADELKFIITDSKAKLLICHSDLLPRISNKNVNLAVWTVVTPPAIREAYHLDEASPSGGVFDANWADIKRSSAGYTRAALSCPDSLIYTSGTTGKPKGVWREAPSMEQLRSTEEMRLRVTGIDRESRVLVPAPLYHTAPNLFAARAARIATVLVVMARFDPEQMLETIEKHAITHVYLVPTMFMRLLGLPKEIRTKYDLSSLEFLLHAGGPCAPQVKAEIIDWLGPKVYEYYGSTESGPVTFSTSDDFTRKPGTVGKPLEGVEVCVLGELGDLMSAGEVGEIFVANPGYPDFTYLNQPEARAELQRGKFLATGDLGYVDNEGYLFLCDRKRDLIISGGVNIYPAEIEAALISVPGVADCAVFGIPDTEFGEALAAVVQPKDEAAATPGLIRRALAGKLASFKIPRVIKISNDLPRDESGKIKKRLLRDPFWASVNRRI
jgi:long-chain acyl-CoA synthetase